VKIFFIGTVDFSRMALEHLLGTGANVVGVATSRESPINADHNDLTDVCTTRGIPVIQTVDINSPDVVRWIAALEPDVVFCFGWSRLLKPALLSVAPMGVVGFHPSALPANRGRHPIVWALALGLPETAATFFSMDGGADSGDILSQASVAIADDDDARTLYDKITRCALRQLDELVPQLAAGSVTRTRQDPSIANAWRKRGHADGQIDWRMSSRGVHNLVRALTKPYVGAHFMYRGEAIAVWKTELVGGAAMNIEPGKVLRVSSEGAEGGGGAVVKCGADAIRLGTTEPSFSPAEGEYL
jgi:methionyl-tRNA formyltransferase